MEHINSWKDIPWSAIEDRLFRLQLRIYKAAANQDWEKVYKLQKLLVNSSTARFLAVRKVTQDNAGKKTPGVDQKVIRTPEERFQLSKKLSLNGRSYPILRTYIPKADGSQRPLGIPTIEDRAKQMVAYFALCPQWEAIFEKESYGFRPGRSVLDAIEYVFKGISRKPKWVLDADITKCFDTINHDYLLDKCCTYPEMRKQLRSWLKAGILDGDSYAFPEMGTPQGGIISPLLANIALHGLREAVDASINTRKGVRRDNRQACTYVRYADNFVLMYPEKEAMEGLQTAVSEFLQPIGLTLHPKKTKIVHTLEFNGRVPPGFTFLGFDVIQRKRWVRMNAAFTKTPSKSPIVTLITPSKEGVRHHKLKLREVIRRYRGSSQERLIQKLNPMIRGWALSKRTQTSSRTFQELDAYVYTHLWKWARKRHPKMSRYKLKEKYWHQVGTSNWVFGVKKGEEVTFTLQKHSKIAIIRHAMIKGRVSPFDLEQQVYWTKRSGKNPLLPPIKARLVKEQHGKCNICRRAFLPEDIIERDHIVPKSLGGKTIRSNVQAVHRYCHQEKTKTEMMQIRRRQNG